MELKYEFYIDAQPEKVWNTLMSPEGTRKIFYGCVIRSTFQEGDLYEYVGPGNDGDETVHVYGNILKYELYNELSCTEHPGPSYRANHAELETRVTFTLETVGNCTKLTLINDQWSDNHPSYTDTEKHWWMILSNVKTLAETGKTLDFGW